MLLQRRRGQRATPPSDGESVAQYISLARLAPPSSCSGAPWLSRATNFEEHPVCRPCSSLPTPTCSATYRSTLLTGSPPAVPPAVSLKPVPPRPTTEVDLLCPAATPAAAQIRRQQQPLQSSSRR